LESLEDKVFESHHRYNVGIDSVKTAGLPMHYLTYEGLVRDPGKEFEQIFDFLLSNAGLCPSETTVNNITRNFSERSNWQLERISRCPLKRLP